MTYTSSLGLSYPANLMAEMKFANRSQLWGATLEKAAESTFTIDESVHFAATRLMNRREFRLPRARIGIGIL